MSVSIRPAIAADAASCGRIVYEAFGGIAASHGFPTDFPEIEHGVQLAAMLIAHPHVFGIVAERDGKIVGSNFMTEGDPIRGIGPITVDPAAQGVGVGRLLMAAALERGKSARGIRLVQDAFNTRSISLYASLGFEVKEPLLLMRGTPRGAAVPGFTVRAMTDGDIGGCARLCEKVHGVTRSAELRDALHALAPFVVERGGRITGYLTAASFWIGNHGVAETEADMTALLAGAASMSAEPLAFLLPTRQASLFRWCLGEGMRAVKPMALMALGDYREPEGSFFPSVFY